MGGRLRRDNHVTAGGQRFMEEELAVGSHRHVTLASARPEWLVKSEPPNPRPAVKLTHFTLTMKPLPSVLLMAPLILASNAFDS